MQIEDLLPLVHAVEQATGYRPHLSTVLRWCLKPNRYGNMLESWMLGGRRMTTVSAVLRFNDANTTAATPLANMKPSASAALESNDHVSAMRQLDAEGI